MQEQHKQRVLKRDAQRRKQIQAAGIEYEFEPLEAQLQKRAKHTKFNTDGL